MTSFSTYRPESDEFDMLTFGKVCANRINDIRANPKTKRYREYLDIVRRQFEGEKVYHPSDEYREKVKRLLPRAIDAYPKKIGPSIEPYRVYFHDEFPIIALPDGVEEDVGVTIHVRTTLDRYYRALEIGNTPEMERVAVACMRVCEFDSWLHVEYFEDENQQTRKIRAHEPVLYDKSLAKELEEQMIAFVAKTRFRAAAENDDGDEAGA